MIERFVPLVPNRVFSGSNPAWVGFQGVNNLTCYCLWGWDIKWASDLCGVYLAGTVKNHHIGVDTEVTIGVSTFYRPDTSAIWFGQRIHVERTSSLRLTGSNIELYAPRGVEMALE